MAVIVAELLDNPSPIVVWGLFGAIFYGFAGLLFEWKYAGATLALLMLSVILFWGAMILEAIVREGRWIGVLLIIWGAVHLWGKITERK